MDDQGRLHMPNGFVGETFDELALRQKTEKQFKKLFPVDEKLLETTKFQNQK